MLLLSERNENISPITVFEEISRENSNLENRSLDFQDYLNALHSDYSIDTTVELHSRIIKEYSVRRSAVRAGKAIIDSSLDTTKSTEEVIEFYQREIHSLSLDYKAKI